MRWIDVNCKIITLSANASVVDSSIEQVSSEALVPSPFPFSALYVAKCSLVHAVLCFVHLYDLLATT